jgi:hypothetical protein
VRKLILVLATLIASVSPAAATPVDAVLDSVQYGAFRYFWYQANPANGLVRDRSQSGSPASIAAVGFGLSAICTGIDHGWITRAAGQTRVLTTLNTFWNGVQRPTPDSLGIGVAMGYQGLFYHFLNMTTGMRMWNSELSTIDTALLLAGIIDAKQYFNTSDPNDVLIRSRADQIYGRVDWTFVHRSSPTPIGIRHGWKPETGYLDGGAVWIGYNEMMILYILAMGSPTHPVSAGDWNTFISNYFYTDPGYGGNQYVTFPPLFGHQYSHCWIDFSAKRDGVMQFLGMNYFENSRRATLAQRAYCIANPGGKVGYGANQWGLTAGDGPNFAYDAHGAPGGFDDGTIQPTAAVSSMPFASEFCLPAMQHLYDTYPLLWGPFGFRDGFNLTTGGPVLPPPWYDPDYLGIDQGPMVMMIENYRNGSIWSRFMQNVDVQNGMTAAGFMNIVGVGVPPVAAQERPVLWSSPNPFTTTTSIHFRLAAGGPARLTVHDLMGREVARLLDGWADAGEHTATVRGEDLKSGVYWYRLSAGGSEVLSKGILIR